MPAVSLFEKPSKPLSAILILALVFGTLDILDAMLFWGFSMDVSPMDVLQGIASGLLGNAAYHAGVAAAVFGALLHYGNFFCLLGVSHMLAVRFPQFSAKPVAFGLSYGLASFVVVHYLILPLTAFHIVSGFYPGVFANALLAQTVLVGLPSALLAGAWVAGDNQTRQPSHEVGQVSTSR